MEMMIDLETLDIKPIAVVLSIGAVKFERDGTIKDKFYRVMHFQQQLNLGRTCSQSSLLWWMQQGHTARNEAFSPVRHDVLSAIADFNEWYGDDVTCVWANDPDFDCAIWESLCLDFNMYTPWNYRNKGALRTVVRESGISVRNVVQDAPGLPHMPVTDCENQVKILMAARENIGRRTK